MYRYYLSLEGLGFLISQCLIDILKVFDLHSVQQTKQRLFPQR
jgi:hypothetical protein